MHAAVAPSSLSPAESLPPVHVILDVETVLLDPWPAVVEAICHTLRSFNRNPDDFWPLEWVVKVPLRDAFSVLLNTMDNSTLDSAQERYHARYAHHAVDHLALRPGADKILGLTQGQQTLGSTYFTHCGRERTQRLVKRFGLGDKMHKVYVGEGGHCAPMRMRILRIIHEELHSQGVLAQILISDDPREIMMGTGLGMQTIGVSYGRYSAEVIHRVHPHHVLSSPADLGKLLSQLSSRQAPTMGMALH